MIRSTRFKIKVARILSKLCVLFFGRYKTVCRKGIFYALDLTEGIDLSIFLFSGFQQHVYSRIKNEKDIHTVLDVGANIGYMSLSFAQKFPNARIYAFEPTHYALEKFKANMRLNPELAKRIEVVNTFVSNEDRENSELTAYSSWQLNVASDVEKHYVHSGIAKSTEGVGQITIDTFCAQHGLVPELIKIDTDGYEYDVLSGMKTVLRQHQPKVVFEIGRYVMSDHKITFAHYLDLFTGYRLIDAYSGKAIDEENHLSIIPKYGTTDLLALPYPAPGTRGSQTAT